MVCAPKRDGSLRFWIEYRRLDAIIERESYAILWMDGYNDFPEAAIRLDVWSWMQDTRKVSARRETRTRMQFWLTMKYIDTG